jgi:tetratricopeptide (TPR) repeat protein
MTNFSSRRRANALAAAACLALLAAGAPPARAQVAAPEAEADAARTKARALLQEGARFMDERQYDRAVETFQEAYRLVPSPKVLYNLGVAYLSVARYADALAALERFLAEATDAPAANQETARRHVADLRGKVSTLTFTSDRSSGELILDGRSLGEVAFDRPLTIDAGPHDLRAVSQGRLLDQRITAPAGGRLAVSLTFEAPAAPVPTAPPPPPAALVAAPDEPRPLTSRPWFWIAAGGVAAAAATVILVVALSRTDYPTAEQTVSR